MIKWSMINKVLVLTLMFVLYSCFIIGTEQEKREEGKVYNVSYSTDFEITGDGIHPNWSKSKWIELVKREQFEEIPLKTRVKMLYSDTGLYFLFYCQDTKLTSSMNADFMDLWKEDVVEVFLWPDENHPVYFEYEISPLNYELPIIIANIDGDLLRWQPFHYEENRRSRHKTTIISGKKEPGATVEGWMAEFFIPYTLLIPLNNVPPKKGDNWRANFYRLDYDLPESVSWLWQLTNGNFHDYNSFGTLIFD